MRKLNYLLAVPALALLASCEGGKSSKFDGFTEAENGLYYKFFNQNENGVKPKEGDVIQMRWKFILHKNDSVMMDSKDYSRDGSGVVEMAVPKASFKGSFEDALMMMAKDDSAAFIVSADSFFTKTQRMNELPKGVNPGDKIRGVFVIKSIKSKDEYEAQQKKMMEEHAAKQKEKEALEKPARDKYLADKKITVKPTPSGLYYIETKKGSGGSPKATDIVTVHYTGTLLDGTKFDSSVDRGQPAEFPLNGVIPGWTEALQLMKKGGKATIILPSNLAYGAAEGGGPIPPYSTLVFDVELIDFKPAPAGGAMPPQGQHGPNDGHNH